MAGREGTFVDGQDSRVPGGAPRDALRQVLLDGLSTEPRPRYPGAVALLVRDGIPEPAVVVGEAVRYSDGSGTLLPPENRVAMSEHTIFDIASLTKLFTAVLALRLVELGAFDLDESVSTWLPNYRDGDRAKVTVRHLLAHISGLPAGIPREARAGGPAATTAAILDSPLVAAPGETFCYSCTNYLTLDVILRRVTDSTLPELLQRYIAGPLQLADTGYLPPASKLDRIAATEADPETGLGILRGQVHDETARVLGGAAGNAGIFSTAADLAVFCEMLRRGGVAHGRRVLRPETVALMLRDHMPAGGEFRHGLGPRIGDSSFMSDLAKGGAFGHTGFTGTSVVIDPPRRLVVILLTNRVHPHRDWSDLGPVRRAVADVAASQSARR